MENVRIFASAFESKKGRLAEGLGTGLQNLLLRFKSGSDLNEKGAPIGVPFCCKKSLIVAVPDLFRDADDQRHVAVLQALLNHATRQVGEVSVKVPTLWSGTEVHVYGFAQGDGRYNKGKRSNTVYLGLITIE